LRKREDTAEGCFGLARDDEARAVDIANDHMRRTLERSAEAWTARATLLERLEGRSNARAEAHALERQDQLEGEEDG
jgi:acetolactate synthase small subunit